MKSSGLSCEAAQVRDQWWMGYNWLTQVYLKNDSYNMHVCK